jgi:PAS domain S-box-containing protein
MGYLVLNKYLAKAGTAVTSASEGEGFEEALKQSEERYYDLLENANDLIQSVDATGAFLYVNRAWKEAMGYSDAEIAGLKAFDVISPHCRDHCSLMFQEILSGKTIPRVDVQFVSKSGKIVELEGSINASSISGNQLVTRGIFRDITERKAVERELQESEDRYRKLVENAPEAILVHSGGRYIYVNTAACRLFGVASAEELIGSEVASSVHPHYREQTRERIRETISTGLPSPLQELKILRRDGLAIDAECTGTSIVFQGKQAVQVIIRDVTERKKVERERAEWSRTLERKVEEKTRHLKEAQAKLIQSAKMASLVEVISGAAHELNNPLAGILGAIQMLRKSGSGMSAELTEGLDVLEGIESAATRCQDIVQDLIRFSTQTPCSFSPMDVNQLLKDTLGIMEEELAPLGIAVEWNPEPLLPHIEGDYVKLLEVFVNLLRNAQSALVDGGRLQIGTDFINNDAEPPQVVINIRDDGCGIPIENLGKIFDPFFTTKPAGKGPGLGLTVSYGVIKRHNGDIDVNSILGQGTTVTVTLPVKQPRRE